jgi:hypothetical protein
VTVRDGGAIARRVPLWEAGVLLLCAVLALVFQLTLPGRLPRAEHEAQVAAVLAKDARPKDALLLFPWWTERARLIAPEPVRVVGHLGSDADDLEDHPRIWVLAQPNLPRADADAFWKAFLEGRKPLGVKQVFGNLELSLYENGRARPTAFSAVEQIATARVYLQRESGERADCPFDGKAHVCPNGSRVFPEWHDLLYAPHRCLNFVPPGGPVRLVAEFSGVPAGHGLSLFGGIIWELAPRNAPNLTTTFVGVEEVESRTNLLKLAIAPGEEGLQRSELKPSPALSAPVTLKLWAQSRNPESRALCVDLKAYAVQGKAQ